MGADSSAENTPNVPKFICPICLPKPKSLGFRWKKSSLGVRSPWAESWKDFHFVFASEIVWRLIAQVLDIKKIIIDQHIVILLSQFQSKIDRHRFSSSKLIFFSSTRLKDYTQIRRASGHGDMKTGPHSPPSLCSHLNSISTRGAYYADPILMSLLTKFWKPQAPANALNSVDNHMSVFYYNRLF